jgi:hypothetical protein
MWVRVCNVFCGVQDVDGDDGDDGFEWVLAQVPKAVADGDLQLETRADGSHVLVCGDGVQLTSCRDVPVAGRVLVVAMPPARVDAATAAPVQPVAIVDRVVAFSQSP